MNATLLYTSRHDIVSATSSGREPWNCRDVPARFSTTPAGHQRRDVSSEGMTCRGPSHCRSTFSPRSCWVGSAIKAGRQYPDVCLQLFSYLSSIGSPGTLVV